MSHSAVIALQKSIIAGDRSLTQLLRETKLIAAKLGLADVERWIDYELKGYPLGVDPPAYREFSTDHVEVRNPYRGWVFAGNIFHSSKATEAISEIERFCTQDSIIVALKKNLPVRDSVGGSHGSEWPQRIVIGTDQFKTIIESVVNELLEWTIELEKRGILGDNLDFNEKEKKSATHQTFNIQKFTGVLGDVTRSQIALQDYSSIHQLLKEHNVPQEQRNQLENLMDELKSAPPAEKSSLGERCKAWVIRNKDALGSAAEIVGKAINAAMG